MKIIPLSKMKPENNKQRRKPVSSLLIVDLRSMRESKGIGVRQAAKASGISPATICRMEMGFTPDVATALKAAIFYGMTIHQMWALKGVDL